MVHSYTLYHGTSVQYYPVYHFDLLNTMMNTTHWVKAVEVPDFTSSKWEADTIMNINGTA